MVLGTTIATRDNAVKDVDELGDFLRREVLFAKEQLTETF